MSTVVEGMLDGLGAPLAPMPGDDLRQCELLTEALGVGQEIDDDVAVVVATSGTTGTPKGAMLSALSDFAQRGKGRVERR